jgi:hypothetical protein
MALAALRVSNPSDHVAAIVARRILALTKDGSNGEHLCDQALASLGVREYYAATGDGTFRLRRLRPKRGFGASIAARHELDVAYLTPVSILPAADEARLHDLRPMVVPGLLRISLCGLYDYGND